jgi:polyphosphate kinase
VAQFNLQDRFLELLDREIALARAGKPARVVIKLNNLEEKVMIDKLYQASGAGVQVQLLIRGICCLIPGREGLSENISVTRIVDRFLEHSRIFWFHNNGREEFYLSSADWMKRNLYKRIEVGFPVYDGTVREELKQMLLLQLEDSQKARHLGAGHYTTDSGPYQKRVRAQTDFYDWLKKKETGLPENGDDTQPAEDRIAASAGKR